MSLGIVIDAILSYVSNRKKEMPRLEEVIFVTDLVGCRKKAEFRRAFPQLDLQNPARLLGNYVHDGFFHFLDVFFEDVWFEVEAEKEFDFGLLRGRADVVFQNEVWEIKYVQIPPSERPYEHHFEQLRLYMLLLDKPVGRLIYLSPVRFAEFVYEGKVGEETARRLYHTWNSPRYHWECERCPYAQFCEMKVK